jgi:hypothetical protein
VRIAIDKCPACGEQVEGTVEVVSGVATIFQNEDGSYTYSGSSDMDWDTSTTITPAGVGNEWGIPINEPPGGDRVPMLVSCGLHEWWTVIEEL